MVKVTDSLVISNSVELLSGGIVTSVPLGAGAIYRLSPGWDLNAPQPTVDIAGMLMLDGERPFGRRASNRTIKLPITIAAPDKTTLAGAREALLALIDADTWTLTWVRDGGAMPVVFDCFRALPTVVSYSVPMANVLLAQIEISFQALPYGRSNVQQQVAFASPLPGSPAPPPSPLVLDNFATISSGPLWSQSGTSVVGPFTGYWDPAGGGDEDGRFTPAVYTNTFSAPVTIDGLTGLTFWMGLGSRHWWELEHQGKSRISLSFTFTDTNGMTLSFGTTRRLQVANSTSQPAWSQISVAIPQGNTAFDYDSVASLSITVTNRAQTEELRYVLVWFDAITAVPPSRQLPPPSIRGAAYVLAGIQGTVHAPISVQAQGPAVPGSPTTITATGAGTYTVPAGTVFLKAEVIGGGGAGAGLTGAGTGAGGGGGEYAAEPVFLAPVGTVIPYTVGVGGVQGASPTDGQPTVFGPVPGGSVSVSADGGSSAAQNATTGGQGGSGSTNAQHYNGGSGRSSTGVVGAGGGSSAGSGGPGSTPSGTGAVTLTGSGNWTVPPGVTTITVTAIGAGGGGGTGSATRNGGGGGGGESATQTFTVTPGQVIPYACGTGGGAGATGGNAGSAGGDTTFTPSTTLRAHGGSGGPSSGSKVSGAEGGQGSTAPIHFEGGDGGSTSPYSGSGGSSAGTSSQGNDGSATVKTGGAAPVGGGAGGNSAGSSSGAGQAGSAPGGGGGGSYTAGAAAGAGASGQITITTPGGFPTNAGAAAPAGGGAGGAGGPSANTAGSAGSAPGGGGGGADSTGTAENGGAGGAGQIVITPYQLPQFGNLILHRPGPGSHSALNPFVAVGNGGDVPNGGTEYPVLPLVAPAVINANSTFVSGTISPWAAANSATVSYSAAGWAAEGPSLLMHGNGTVANPQAQSEQEPVTGGNWYSARAQVYSPQGCTAQIAISWFDASSSLISTSSGPATTVTAGVTAGTPLRTSGVQAPANAVTALIIVQINGTPASTVLLYVDNVAISSVPLNARFGTGTGQVASTYSVVAVNSSWHGSAARNVTVTVKQYEAPGGSSYSTSITASVTPAQITNGIAVLGELTLPLKDIPPDNMLAYFTVTVTSGDTADRFLDVLLMDTTGQTVIINEPPGSGYSTYYVDEPDPDRLLGRHLGSQAGRERAISVMDACLAVSGGALTVDPGDSLLLAYSADAGAPAIGVSYYPRWFFDRVY